MAAQMYLCQRARRVKSIRLTVTISTSPTARPRACDLTQNVGEDKPGSAWVAE